MSPMIWIFTFAKLIATLTCISGKEYISVENKDVKLQWNINPESKAQLVSVVHPSGKNIFLISENKGHDSGGGYNGRWNFTGDVTIGNIEFIFKNITKSDAGVYYTQIGDTLETGSTLVVYCLDISPLKPISEEELTFKCSVSSVASLTSLSFQRKLPTDLNFDLVFLMNNSDCTGESKTDKNDVVFTTSCGRNKDTMLYQLIVQSVPDDWHKQFWRCAITYGPEDEYESNVIQLDLAVPFKNITIYPESDILGISGDPVQLTCLSFPGSRPKSVITWFLVTENKAYNITNNSSSKIIIDKNDNSKQITESRLTYFPAKADTGIYCRGSSDIFQTVESPVKLLDIRDSSDWYPTLYSNTTSIYTEGMAVALTCELSCVSREIKLSWKCKGRPVASIKGHLTDMVREVLVFTIDRSYDENACECTATHPYWAEGKSKNIKFYVLYPPQGKIEAIQRVPQMSYYTRSDVVKLICRSPSRSKPLVNITWQCKGIDRTAESRTIGEDRLVSQLTITVDTSYTCETCSCNISYSRTNYNKSSATRFVVIDKDSNSVQNIVSTVLFASSGFLFIATCTSCIVSLINRRKVSSSKKAITSRRKVTEADTAADISGPSNVDLGERNQPPECHYHELELMNTFRRNYNRDSYQQLGERVQPVENHYQQLRPPYAGITFESTDRNNYQELGERQQHVESHYLQLGHKDNGRKKNESCPQQ